MSRVTWWSHGIFGSALRRRRARLGTSRRLRSLTAAAFAIPLILGPGQAAAHALERVGPPKAPQAPAVHGVTTLKPKRITPQNDARGTYRPKGTSWPAASAGSAVLPAPAMGHARGSRAHVAGTPVWARSVAPSTGSYHGPTGVNVRVAAHNAATAVGVSGLIFTVSGADGTGGKLQVDLDYSSFGQIYGGNYASRLHLASLPACALTTPQKAACRRQTPLATNQDRATTSLSATVDLSSAASPRASSSASSSNGAVASPTLVIAATDSGSGDQDGGDAGTYGATPLKPAGSWSAGGSTGSFTYDYPIPVADASTTLQPTVGLSYDSGSVDGQTSSTRRSPRGRATAGPRPIPTSSGPSPPARFARGHRVAGLHQRPVLRRRDLTLSLNGTRRRWSTTTPHNVHARGRQR